MRTARPCAVCGEMTTRFLFKDKNLGISICSRRCEYEYFDTLTPDINEQMIVLRHIDCKIEATKRCGRIMWSTAGFGLLTVAIGFWMANATIFIAGVFPLTFGAFSTSHFEDRRNKLMMLRKRIVI